MAAPWRLVTYADVDGSERVGASLLDGIVVEVPDGAAASGVIELMQRWDEVAEILMDWEPSAARPIEGARVLAPLRYPRKLICAGANYGSHLEEMKVAPIPDRVTPFFFLLPPTTTIIGPGEAIQIPTDPSWRVDWEAELAIVIGRKGRRISAERASEHVAAYTIVNDVSARGRHRRPDPLAPPFEYDWLGSKGADTFCPMGPGLTPAWLIEDPGDLVIRCWVNDVLKQEANTGGMLNGVGALVAAVSAIVTLEPGDVIATGTPSGVGVARGEQLGDGDEVRIEIDSLGRLVNSVRAG
jgi:2,4-didehydro-3-deoxy-L-rhamnonate hydrolase